jgi:hypothetical protein
MSTQLYSVRLTRQEKINDSKVMQDIATVENITKCASL